MRIPDGIAIAKNFQGCAKQGYLGHLSLFQAAAYFVWPGPAKKSSPAAPRSVVETEKNGAKIRMTE